MIFACGPPQGGSSAAGSRERGELQRVPNETLVRRYPPRNESDNLEGIPATVLVGKAKVGGRLKTKASIVRRPTEYGGPAKASAVTRGKTRPYERGRNTLPTE